MRITLGQESELPFSRSSRVVTAARELRNSSSRRAASCVAGSGSAMGTADTRVTAAERRGRNFILAAIDVEGG